MACPPVERGTRSGSGTSTPVAPGNNGNGGGELTVPSTVNAGRDTDREGGDVTVT
ncbi:MAG TPA: hypothetical protein VHD60_01170 [Candidatus Saccharimonadales bacterium]|nr:hypothetical protein [Candidatus Saccharimonadales bacterium]